MPGYETIIGSAILGTTPTDEAASRAALLYAVQRAITCPLCGDVLDYRRATLVETTGGGAYVACTSHFDPSARERVADAVRARGGVATFTTATTYVVAS